MERHCYFRDERFLENKSIVNTGRLISSSNNSKKYGAQGKPFHSNLEINNVCLLSFMYLGQYS